MKINSDLTFPLLIILIGVGYLLANMGVIPLTPWEIFLRYWPAIIVYWGAKQLLYGLFRLANGKFFPLSDVLFATLLLVIGAYLLAPRLGYEIDIVPWSVLWPIMLIILGIALMNRTNVFSSQNSRSSLIGEVSRGGSSWYLEDMSFRHGIGEVRLDLTHAIIPDKTIDIDIQGMIGEVTIFLPANLPLRADCYTSIGDITVLEHSEEGLSKHLVMQTPDYDEATRKLNLTVRWKIGEVSVRRLG